MSISDVIIVMKQGVVQQVEKPQAVYDDPVNLFVAKFLGTPAINVFKGRVLDKRLFIGEQDVMSAEGYRDGDVIIGIRPEGFTVREDGPFSCEFVRLDVMGRDVSIISKCPECEEETLRAIVSSDDVKGLGLKSVAFELKPSKVLLFDPVTEKRLRPA